LFLAFWLALYKHFLKDIWSVRADEIAKTCLDNILVNKFFLKFFWADDFYVLTAIAIAFSKKQFTCDQRQNHCYSDFVSNLSTTNQGSLTDVKAQFFLFFFHAY
jgi:hypothetical protein